MVPKASDGQSTGQPCDLPSYDDLPLADTGTRSGWGLFGADDSVGLINLLTAPRVIDAVASVRTGKVFALNAAVDFFSPPLFRRAAVRHDVAIVRDGAGLDDTLHALNPQSSSQWDSLGHVAFRPGEFYNGASLDEVLHGGRNTVEHWARRGIVGRAVLLDLYRTAIDQGRRYDPGTSHPFSVSDLEAAREAAGVTIRPGDILLLRTGFMSWYAGLDQQAREAIQTRESLHACGLEHTEDMARYLWDLHVCAAAADCPSLEVWPMDYDMPFGNLHTILIGQFGLAIGELWSLDDLADDCAADGVHECLLASAPLNVPGGIGSTANALAIK
jgi:kynurenine formamidase